MDKRTTAAAWVKGIAEMLAAEGLDARALLGDAGIDPVALEAPAALLSRGRSGQRLRGGEGDARLLDGCTVRARETVGWARELLGGNGILLDHHVGRFVADAEAIYSYEGTREINSLVVGRAITGFGAFV